MFQIIQGPLTVVGRLLLATIFFMAAVGNKIPHFSEVAKVMDSVASRQAEKRSGSAMRQQRTDVRMLSSPWM